MDYTYRKVLRRRKLTVQVCVLAWALAAWALPSLEMPMLNGPPLFTLERTYVLRILYSITLFPLGSFFLWGAYESMVERNPSHTAAGILGLLGVGALVLAVRLFQRELDREVTLYATGLKERVGERTVEVRFDDVTELRMKATQTNWGGHFGLVGALVAAGKSSKALRSSNTNLQLEVYDSHGHKVVLTSNEKNVLRGVEEVYQRVNPRLLKAALEKISQGGTAVFGRFTVGRTGVTYANQEEIPYAQLAELETRRGYLYLKRVGKWFSKGGVRVSKTPNHRVLLDLVRQLSGKGTAPRAAVTAGEAGVG